MTRNQAFLQSGISCIKEPVTSARLLIALFLLGSLCLSVADSLAAADDTSAMEQVIRMVGSLCLSVADSLAAADDTSAMEQVIRINMKMGIVGNRVQAWLAAGGTPEQVEKLGQDVGTYLNSFQLTQAEASMDSLFSIVVGATASSESAQIGSLAAQIIGLNPLIQRWMVAAGDQARFAPVWAQLTGSLFSGSLANVQTQIDAVKAFVAVPNICGATATPSAPTTATLVGTLVATSKNTVLGPVGFDYLMGLVTGAGVNFSLFGGNWVELEPSAGTFDFAGKLVQPLTEMLARYPQFQGFGFVITLINGDRRVMPAELTDLAFDDPGLLLRFDALIDALAAEPLSAKLDYILIGNEVDSVLTAPADALAFVTFYKHAVARIHLKLPKAKVSVSVTSGGASSRTAQLFASLSALSDFVAYTYYPVEGSPTGTWVMRPSSEMQSDLDWLAALACEKPFAFTEIGYASSADNASSESLQADFVRTVFTDLDTYRKQGRIAFLYYEALYDLPPDACAAYTFQNSAVADSVCSFLRSLGLRSWDTDVPRQAWDAFSEGIAGWNPGPLVAAVLPASRSVQVGTSATAFATIINTASYPVSGCTITPAGGVPVTFSYQATDPATNAPTGSPNTPVNVPGFGSQSFVIALTPTAPFNPQNVSFAFACTNVPPAPVETGLNTLLLSGSTVPVPDIVALVATATNDGTLHIPTSTNANAFAVATVNLGSGDVITVKATTPGVVLPLTLTLCQTDPLSGQCFASPSSSVMTMIASKTTPTFAVFAIASGGVPFAPATNRIAVQFIGSDGAIRGATNVAVEEH